MNRYEQPLKILKSLREVDVGGLGPSIDALERLSAGHADDAALQGVMDQLPLHTRLAAMHRGRPDVVSHLEEIARRIEAEFGNVRELQARKSFAAFGDALGAPNAHAYLVGTDKLEGVTEIPTWPTDFPDHLPENVLVDGRIIELVGLVETCRLAELKYDGNDETLVPYDPKIVKSGLRWMRFQDGRRNHSFTPSVCRANMNPREVGVNAMEAIARYVQDDMVLWKHYMDVLESVHAVHRDLFAVLGVWYDGPELDWYWYDNDFPIDGAASRGE